MKLARCGNREALSMALFARREAHQNFANFLVFKQLEDNKYRNAL